MSTTKNNSSIDNIAKLFTKTFGWKLKFKDIEELENDKKAEIYTINEPWNLDNQDRTDAWGNYYQIEDRLQLAIYDNGEVSFMLNDYFLDLENEEVVEDPLDEESKYMYTIDELEAINQNHIDAHLIDLVKAYNAYYYDDDVEAADTYHPTLVHWNM